MNVFLLPTSTAGTGHWIQEMNRNQGKIKSSSSLPHSECARASVLLHLEYSNKIFVFLEISLQLYTADESCILKGEPPS